MKKRRTWDPETKAKIVLAGVTGTSVRSLCEDYGICPSQYYRWRERFLERLPHLFEDLRTTRESALRKENESLKRLVGEMTLAMQRTPGD